jgi:glucose dehydrogenase
VITRSDVSPSGWIAFIGATRTRNVRAFDALSGEELWHSDVLDDFMASTVTYIVTGDSYTDVPTKGTDAIFALDIASGKVRWRNQVTSSDTRPHAGKPWCTVERNFVRRIGESSRARTTIRLPGLYLTNSSAKHG